MKKILFLISVLGFIAAKSQNLQFSVGEKAPNFSATTHTGNQVSLASLTKKGAVILLFYRGYWCPFCNKQLQELNDSLSLIQVKGATVVAISPEKEASVDKTIAKTKAAFEIISDTTNQILKQYGVNFTVDSKTVERYKQFNIDFSVVNANSENILPVPAVFIIDKNGTFKYIYFNKDYRKRPSVSELLQYL
jgi:peroxiredoxin